MTQEKWKRVPDFPYQVSNHGRVRSLTRKIYYVDGRIRHFEGQLLKPGISEKLGYPIVVLSNHGRRKTFYVHLLVAAAFKRKPKPGEEINHKDGNRANPRVENLEWGTHQYNLIHSIKTGLRKTFVGFGVRRRNPNARDV